MGSKPPFTREVQSSQDTCLFTSNELQTTHNTQTAIILPYRY